MTQLRGNATYGPATSRPVTLIRDIREVSAGDAPVVARVPKGAAFNCAIGTTAEIRTLDGNFYHQPRYGLDPAPLTPGMPRLDIYLTQKFGHHDTEQQAESAVRDGLQGIILIDGSFWARISEPVLVLDRHGLTIFVSPETGFSPWRVYSLKETAEAVEAARLLRLEHGMTAEPHASALDPGVELIMPEAIATLPHAVRMKAVHDTARARVATATNLLTDLSPRTLHEASELLARTADELNAQTRQMMWTGGKK